MSWSKKMRALRCVVLLAFAGCAGKTGGMMDERRQRRQRLIRQRERRHRRAGDAELGGYSFDRRG